MESDTPVDDSCEAWQADDIKIPELIPSSDDDHQFYIAYEVEFIFPPAFPLENEADYLVAVPGQLESSMSFHQFWAPCKFLERENLPWNEISNMLTWLGVPLHKQPFMVHRISACADEIAGKYYNRKRKVLPMMVSISIVVDYCVYEQEDASTIAIRRAAQFSELRPVPANEASVQALEKETIQETSSVKKCMICLDGLQIGSEVRRMPCKHVFHEGCIFNWLRVSGFCPLCRFQLPA